MEKKKTVGIRELKNRASRIVDEVRETNEPYVVTKRGEPVAVLRPWTAKDARADREERMRSALVSMSELAERVAQATGKKSAVAAVSEQRR